MGRETETVTEYQTVEETKEVERTYCDTCGERCDDEHVIVPAYECDDCHEERTTCFGSVEQLFDWVESTHEGHSPDPHDSNVMSIVLIATTPVTATLSMMAAVKNDTGWTRPYFEGFLGALLWTAFLVLLVL
jgi:hypothetical protein